MKVGFGLAGLVLAAAIGCRAPNPADSVPNACLAADLVVETEQVKLNLAVPLEQTRLSLEFCRILPDQDRNKALILVVANRHVDGAETEDAFVGRMFQDPADGWKLIASDPIYAGVVLKPAPVDTEADAGVQ